VANNFQESGPPRETANVTPMDAGSAQTRQIVEAVKASVAVLTSDVKEIRNYRYTDLLLHIGAFAAGIVLVVTMMVAAYFKLEDKLQTLSTATTRVDTKLEDLLLRIPPIPATPARK
jgi:hypothetical protein